MKKYKDKIQEGLKTFDSQGNAIEIQYAGERKFKNSKLKFNIIAPIEIIEQIHIDSNTKEELPHITTYRIEYDRKTMEDQIEKQILEQMKKITKDKNLKEAGSRSMIGFMEQVKNYS